MCVLVSALPEFECNLHWQAFLFGCCSLLAFPFNKVIFEKHRRNEGLRDHLVGRTLVDLLYAIINQQPSTVFPKAYPTNLSSVSRIECFCKLIFYDKIKNPFIGSVSVFLLLFVLVWNGYQSAWQRLWSECSEFRGLAHWPAFISPIKMNSLPTSLESLCSCLNFSGHIQVPKLICGGSMEICCKVWARFFCELSSASDG